jgi:hypothetical protein
MSVPSSEKRFCPRYDRCRNCSSPSTSQIRLRSARFFVGVERREVAARLHLVPEPVDLHVVVEVLELVADRAGVDLAELCERVGHGAAVVLGSVVDDERRRELAQLLHRRAEEGGAQLRMAWRLGAERIEAGELVAVIAERLHERRRARDDGQGAAQMLVCLRGAELERARGGCGR